MNLIIKELNVIFKRLGWKLLPEDNGSNRNVPYSYGDYFVSVVKTGTIYIDRSFIPYKKHLNKYSIQLLDEYVLKLIKPTCLKCGIEEVVFGSTHIKQNRIKLN